MKMFNNIVECLNTQITTVNGLSQLILKTRLLLKDISTAIRPALIRGVFQTDEIFHN